MNNRTAMTIMNNIGIRADVQSVLFFYTILSNVIKLAEKTAALTDE